MFVLDVIPLSRTAPGILSYRSKSDMPVGSIVDIVLRKTPTQGIVIGSTPVTDAKEMIKNARFLLAKSAPSSSGMLPEAILTAAAHIAKHQATSVGAILAALFSEHISNGIPLPTSLRNSDGYTQTLVEDAPLARVAEYRHVIEGYKDKTVLLVVPTLAEATFWKSALSAYHPLVLSGALTKARRVDALTKAPTHAGLIIATPSFSWVPIENIGAIIIDRVSAGTYTLPKRPYVDVPYALTTLAQERTIPLVIGDYPLPLEYRKQGVGVSVTHSIELCDARKPADDVQQEDEPWQIFPEHVRTLLTDELSTGGHAVILATRTGYAPAVVCRDCGQALVDERGMPLSFTTAEGKRVFRSSDGVTILDARMRCPRCDSWNLLPLGIGQERVAEEVRKLYPEANIVEATSESLRTPAAARKLIAQVHIPGTITVGGEALLPWLLTISPDRAPLGIIASADSLLALPFWRSRERFVRLSYFFASLCRTVLLITRHPEDTAVTSIITPGSSAFWDEERMLRSALHYPPYGTLITLTIEGTVSVVSKTHEHIVAALAPYPTTTLPDQSVGANTIKRVVVLSLSEDSWPNEALSYTLQGLPPSVRVRIDPESIW